ncbi:MAG: hypothetical protein IKJ44_04935 [Elusimicrobiaceae bacterium]|nr:hypothetical protein [Elusimicrobiaceae bacterium]
MKRFFSFLAVMGLLFNSSFCYGNTPQRAGRLLQLQAQAHAILQTNPQTQQYIKEILLYSSAVLLMAQMKQLSAQQFRAALAADLQEVAQLRTRPLPKYTPGRPYYMAAKKAATDPAQLSLFPEEAPAPKPAPKKEDLSWLDAPQEELKSTRPTPAAELFEEAEFQTKKPQKSYLSKRVEKEYGHTNLFKKLTPQETQGLFQRLDQAAAINAKSGKEAAQKFLHEMANKFPKAQILFISAKRMLLGAVLFMVADHFIQFGQENPSLQRLMANPHLFLQADENQIALLAQDPQAVQYAELLVQGLEEIAQTPITAEDIAYMRKSTEQMQQSRRNEQLQHISNR